MSSHFNYEIDERNMRERLRNMTVSYKEEAWAQFEEFSNLNRATHRTSSLPSFHFNINRTLILPFVFGGVIILFSLLLFNFISINNKKITEVVKKELVNPKPQPKKEIAVKSIPLPVAEHKKDLVAPKNPTVATVINKISTAPSVAEIKAAPSITTPSASTENTWKALETGKIYISPAITSEVIGMSDKNINYKALEETIYFIKISFNKENKTQTGYIRKDVLRKSGSDSNVGNSPRKRKKRQAENLQSIQVPVQLSGSGEDKEPELR
ncbi:MAG: hypothetical protein H0W61_01935 [Bacteroidetes bacterium]|nr:hypothetical protein [Bacteroidota bacterium]